MRAFDRLALGFGALREHRSRSALALLGIAIAVAAVFLLSAVGRGVRGRILGSFAQFGTNLLQVSPGRSETFGVPGAMGGTTHDLTLGDAVALARLASVQLVVPTVIGEAAVEAGGRSRRVSVIGTTTDASAVWKVRVARGTFLPGGDLRRGANVAVLGAALARELLGDAPALGSWVRVGGRRMRVAGVMEARGELLGFDMDDLVYVPVSTALAAFDLSGVSEIDVTFAHGSDAEAVSDEVRRLLVDRHGEDDVTIITQTAALGVLDRILSGVTLGVSSIAAISMLVGAVGILSTMWIAVGQRTQEIGILRSLGATLGDVQALFLLEAVLLALSGGMAGIAGACAVLGLASWLVPDLPLEPSSTVLGLALAASMATGLFAGVAPARRAARLDPLEALHAE